MMKLIKTSTSLMLVVLVSLISGMANAHLMVAQHGTLNFVKDGAYMVISLPISAIKGADDDADGNVSMLEFNLHRAEIVERVEQQISLTSEAGEQRLQGILLSPVAAHGSPGNEISQLTVMGKFTQIVPGETLNFHVGLYGSRAQEQRLEITATRTLDNQKHKFELSLTAPSIVLFSDDHI